MTTVTNDQKLVRTAELIRVADATYSDPTAGPAAIVALFPDLPIRLVLETYAFARNLP